MKDQKHKSPYAKKIFEKYPNTVCLDCLKEAWEDTQKYENITLPRSEYYTAYEYTCEVCGEYKECTESRDFGYPSFLYAHIRLKAKKLKKIIDGITS